MSVTPSSAPRALPRTVQLKDDTPVVLRVMTPADAAPIAAFAPPSAPILTVGSLSKLFWGGLRVGWIRASEDLLARIARLKIMADLGGSVLSQLAALKLLARAERVKQKRRAQVRERFDLLTGLLARVENLLTESRGQVLCLAHALETLKPGPWAPRRMAIVPAAALGIIIGTKCGETSRSPTSVLCSASSGSSDVAFSRKIRLTSAGRPMNSRRIDRNAAIEPET